VIVSFVRLYKLIELVLANNIQYLRENKFARMHDNYVAIILKSTKLPFSIQIVKSKMTFMPLYVNDILDILKI